jgi:hypothetical protein
MLSTKQIKFSPRIHEFSKEFWDQLDRELKSNYRTEYKKYFLHQLDKPGAYWDL